MSFKALDTDGWVAYGPAAGESLPLLDATVTKPNLGTSPKQEAWYMVKDGVVHVYLNVIWGGSGCTAGSGTYRVLCPPVLGRGSMGAGMTIGEANIGGDIFAVKNIQKCAVAWGAGAGANIPVARAASILPQKYWYTDEATVATVASGTTSFVVTHGFGVAPGSISVTPVGNLQTAGATQWWYDTVTATQFTIHATGAAGANLTGPLNFRWTAFSPQNGTGQAGLFVTDSHPWVWGSSGQDIEVVMRYPLINATPS